MLYDFKQTETKTKSRTTTTPKGGREETRWRRGFGDQRRKNGSRWRECGENYRTTRRARRRGKESGSRYGDRLTQESHYREVITKKGERVSHSTLLSGFLSNFSPSCLEGLKRELVVKNGTFLLSILPRIYALKRFSSPQAARNMNSPWRLLCDSFSVCWENLTIIRKVDVQYPRQFKSHVHNNWFMIVDGLLVRNVATLCSFEVINCCSIVCR